MPSKQQSKTINSKHILIGDFQFSILEQVKMLDDYAFGIAIRNNIREELQREVHTPQVYTALIRLEKLGLLASEVERKSSAGRRGRPRRYYQLTTPGQQMLDAGQYLSNNSVSRTELNRHEQPWPTTA